MSDFRFFFLFRREKQRSMNESHIETLSNLNYCSSSSLLLSLNENVFYSGCARIGDSRICLIYRENERNFLQVREMENNENSLINSVELVEIVNPIDDLNWSSVRNELFFVSRGNLLTFSLDEEKVRDSIEIEPDNCEIRVCSNNSTVVCLHNFYLSMFDVKTLKFVRRKRLDHLYEDVDCDEKYFAMVHPGKCEIFNHSLISIRRFPMGGTSIVRFNSKLWLFVDTFDQRVFWQSFENKILAIDEIHQPKSIIVLPNTGKIFLLCSDPNRFIVFHPIEKL